jgi:flagellin-like hook-associated protein FlgL
LPNSFSERQRHGVGALSRSQILQQAGTAMVAQANQLPQGVLALLR